MVSVLMVCTGNICRSPTADGVLRQMIKGAGLADAVSVDSAGTHDYHVGEAPDRRSQTHARSRGYDLSGLRARQVESADFARFDLILAMDKGHYAQLVRLSPPQYRERVRMFCDYARQHGDTEVPDPYYGGADGFEHVLDLVEDGCRGILAEIQRGKVGGRP
ncbi:low molecular weight protein-tyrosine-phosphatase [Chitinibacteraceae bacterium HSL-7]